MSLDALFLFTKNTLTSRHIVRSKDSMVLYRTHTLQCEDDRFHGAAAAAVDCCEL